MTTAPVQTRRRHRHTAVSERVLRQREGVPYEVERRICAQCGRVLEERPLRRTSA